MEAGTIASLKLDQAGAQSSQRRAYPAQRAEENNHLPIGLARTGGGSLNANLHAIVTLDINGHITDWNRGAETILGHTRSTVLGQSSKFIFSKPERSPVAFKDELAAASQTGVSIQTVPIVRRDGTNTCVRRTTTPVIEMGAGLIGFLCILQEASVNKASVEFLLAEARHRLKNTISVVRSLVYQTEMSAATVREYRDALLSRLTAIAEATDLLDGNNRSVTLHELMRSVLRPHGELGDRIHVSGPSVGIRPDSVAEFAIVLHELATNAAKYGALSCINGRVDVKWRMLAPLAQDESLLEIVWCESNGPTILPPKRRGFGTRLLERGGSQGLHDPASLAFRPDGFEYRTSLRATC